MDSEYLGIVKLEENQYADFYSQKIEVNNFLDNEYVIVADEVYKFRNGFFSRVNYPTIDSKWAGKIKPKNIEQLAAMDMLLDVNSTIKLITGTWGTGKTLLLISSALKLLEENKFDKIVWIRNNVQVANTDPIGALPGNEVDKMLPYVMPMADHCGGIEGVLRLIDTGRLEVIPLGFLRGRSIRNSIIRSSEAEN